MAKSLQKVVGCPSCGVLEEFTAYTSIIIPTDREMRDQILDESLFFWRCGSCDYETQMVYSCLYQDKVRKFMIYVQPVDEDPAVLKQIPVEGLEDIKKRIVTNIEEMKEKLLILEADLNDYATELVKVALTQVVTAKWGVAPEKSFYCGIDAEKNTIEYVFYLNEEEPPVYQGIKMDVYNASLQIVESIVTEEPNAFLHINSDVAKELLEQHQHIQQAHAEGQAVTEGEQPEESKE